MLAAIILMGICTVCVGWRISARRSLFAYRKMDAEMDALRHMVKQTGRDHAGGDGRLQPDLVNHEIKKFIH